MIGIGPNVARRPTANVWSSGADIDFMFAEDASVVPRAGRAQLQCVRAGDTATVFNRYGVQETVPANTPRLNHDPSVLRFENKLLWSEKLSASLTWSYGNLVVTADAALGPDGSLTAETLTPTAVDSYLFQNIDAGPQETNTFSVWLRADTPATIAIFLIDRGGSTANTSVNCNVTQSWQRFSVTRTTAVGATGVAAQIGGANTLSSGEVIQAWGAQVNSGPAALPYRRTGATAQPKEYACKGLLVEEARTNSIRNNTMVGTVAGTPGTVPTNWQVGQSAGLTSTVVGAGSEGGVDYIDVRWSGTAGSGAYARCYLETGNGVPASTGQTWTVSSFLRLVGGSLNGIYNFAFTLDENTAAGVYVFGSVVNFEAPTSSPLSQQRVSVTRTLSGGATIGALRPYIAVGLSNGSAIDFTLRIGMPQLERGAFATSVIPTSGAAVTRNADNVTAALGAWFNASAGTIVAESENTDSSAGYPRVWCLHDGSSNNTIQLVLGGAADVISAEIKKAGNFFMQSAYYGYVGVRTKTAMAWSPTDAILVKDGVASAADSSVQIPTVSTLSIGSDHSGNSVLNGHIRRLAYRRTRLPDADLQQLSA